MMTYPPTKTREKALEHVTKSKNKYKQDSDLLSLIKNTIDIWNDCKEINDNWTKLKTSFKPIKETKNFTQEQLKNAIYEVARLYPTRTSIDNKNTITEYLDKYKIYIQDATKGTLAPTTIDDIDDDYGGTESILSLLSKFFCLLNEDVYPIYDSIAKASLIALTEKRPRCFDVSYTRYTYLIDNFKIGNKLTHHKAREFDKFLWLYGQTL